MPRLSLAEFQALPYPILDVRAPIEFAQGHVPGALNLPHRAITEEALAAWPRDMLFVVYCAGPHCTGADRGVVKALLDPRTGPPEQKGVP